MPPKAMFSKETMLDAAFQVAREAGAEAVNARTVAQKLCCSTQPVMRMFSTIDALKQALYQKVDAYQTEYLMQMGEEEDLLLGFGLRFVRFAIEEPALFRFLFQSGYAKENNVLEMVEAESLAPLRAAMQEALGIEEEGTKRVFLSLAVFAYGYASLIVNNGLEYDEAQIAIHLTRVYNGAILAEKEGV